MRKTEHELRVVPVTHFVSRKKLSDNPKYVYEEQKSIVGSCLMRLGFFNDWLKVSYDSYTWCEMLEKIDYRSDATFKETAAALSYLVCYKKKIPMSLEDIQTQLGVNKENVAKEAIKIINDLKLYETDFKEIPVELSKENYQSKGDTHE